MQDLAALSSAHQPSPASSATAAALHLGRLVPPAATASACCCTPTPQIPGGLIGVLYSSSFPLSVSSTPLLCLPPARTTQQAPHPSPDQTHTDANLSQPITSSVCLCIIICSCTPGAHSLTLQPPGLPPVQPSRLLPGEPTFCAGTTRLPATRHPSRYLPPCCAALCPFQRTGRGNIDLPPGT